MKTVIEPFRTKSVEPIPFTTETQRRQLLKKSGYNLFQLSSQDITIDLLTDSGTSAMSSSQWAAVMSGDESYAGSLSFDRFDRTIKDIFGFQYVLPVHQGRAAERLLFEALVWPGQIIPSNNHFDTTRGNIEELGATAMDLPTSLSADIYGNDSFKGNIELNALRNLIEKHGKDNVPFAMITITNNANGGHPVSMDNIAACSKLLRKHSIPFIIDAARFAENAWLMKQRDPKLKDRSVRSIVRQIFSYADGCLMSAKKDGLANIGGFIAINDLRLFDRLKQSLILTEGFPTYGGLAGRDLEAIAVGLQEVLDDHYLCYREHSAAYLAKGLLQADIPLSQPCAMHAIYIDAKAFLPHIEPCEYPGQALAVELYLEAGIRTCEVGSVMFGKNCQGSEELAPLELVRLALPRRVYTQSHYDYVIEAVTNVFNRRKNINGLKIVEQAEILRHFTARFEPTFAQSNNLSFNQHCPTTMEIS